MAKTNKTKSSSKKSKSATSKSAKSKPSKAKKSKSSKEAKSKPGKTKKAASAETKAKSKAKSKTKKATKPEKATDTKAQRSLDGDAHVELLPDERDGLPLPGDRATERILRDVLGVAKKLKTKIYEEELARLQVELVKLQEWIKNQGLKVVILFEGRDAAGKGGVIKRITQCLNPRVCPVIALPAPSNRETSQWYFQRYIAHLPAAGEMALFDRSWYNRAGVEHVMGFCSDSEYREFLRSCPEFERMLIRSGIILIKYWFSVSDEEQERRFQARMRSPVKRWKLSPMDLQSRERWVEYSKAKDMMFAYTDIRQAPWYVVRADDKKRARLNTISHLLSMIPYEDLTPAPISLPLRQAETGYVRPPMNSQNFVPDVFPLEYKE